ncbi:MAG: hypothetical protein QOI00_1565 [Chloroflexota bacterium]|jgi:hypothetical protein|nr:hypothetical protein [Chloroflexota bacterium]
MYTDQQVVERVEDAVDKSPFCHHCGQPTTIAQRDHVLWLECTTLAERRGRLASLLRFDFASFHTQRPVLELCAAA